MRKFILSLVVMLTALNVGCGAYKKEMAVDVGAEETAYMVSLEGNTLEDQKKFSSVEFLESKKVAEKRIILPQRKRSTGRMWFSFEYIPTARVIKISRTLVQREWTDDGDSGTSNRSQKLHVESLDSVGFGVGATIAARIDESKASTFLYYFNGQQLETIIDGPVRGYALSLLSEAFGQLNLEECKVQKTNVFSATRKELIRKFGEMGITIDFFGASEGLTYDNEKIQDAIDDQVVSEAAIIAQANKKLANDKMREDKAAEAQLEVTIAQSKADAARKLADAKEAMTFDVELFERRKKAEALPILAANFGNIKILPSNSPLLLELGLGSGK
jgi:hypothetical protein